MTAYSVASLSGIVPGFAADAGWRPTIEEANTPGWTCCRAALGRSSSYVAGFTWTGFLGSVRSYRNTLFVNVEVGVAPVATIAGPLSGMSKRAVVLNPSSVANPGASAPNAPGRFATRAFVAGANGSSGSVDPSSRRLDGNGTVPELASITGAAAPVGCTWKVVMTAMSVVGKTVLTAGNGPETYSCRICSSAAPFAAFSCGVFPGRSAWFAGSASDCPCSSRNIAGSGWISLPPCTFTPFGPPRTAATMCRPASQARVLIVDPGAPLATAWNERCNVSVP